MVVICSFCFVNSNYNLNIYRLNDDFSVELAHKLVAHTEPVFGLLFHPTAKLLYSCGSEGIFAWDYSTAQCIARWKNCSDPSFRVTCLCFIPDRALLCAGASDGTLFLLDTLNG